MDAAGLLQAAAESDGLDMGAIIVGCIEAAEEGLLYCLHTADGRWAFGLPGFEPALFVRLT